ncbi:hypothetical protein [Sporosarcina sp. HYO08]|uniref:hypothetical protein n=1 Tax=Sporosarcina sp. HYO08 TaxID=1759557 RepID=UPI0007921D58|nr:hypothetical protein [Sporosarcina sp. HYO08]KXH87096.1 hypothetical protein AU377_00525 [Sporosarcina sp. HYO08]
MSQRMGKIGLFTGLISFVLLIVSVRNVLDQTLVWKNYLAFGVFGLIVGTVAFLLLFYGLKIAFWIFMPALVLGFLELFRNFIFVDNGFGDLIGILSLFLFSTFGLVLALGVQFVVKLMRKNK